MAYEGLVACIFLTQCWSHLIIKFDSRRIVLIENSGVLRRIYHINNTFRVPYGLRNAQRLHEAMGSVSGRVSSPRHVFAAVQHVPVL